MEWRRETELIKELLLYRFLSLSLSYLKHIDLSVISVADLESLHHVDNPTCAFSGYIIMLVKIELSRVLIFSNLQGVH